MAFLEVLGNSVEEVEGEANDSLNNSLGKMCIVLFMFICFMFFLLICKIFVTDTKSVQLFFFGGVRAVLSSLNEGAPC